MKHTKHLKLAILVVAAFLLLTEVSLQLSNIFAQPQLTIIYQYLTPTTVHTASTPVLVYYTTNLLVDGWVYEKQEWTHANNAPWLDKRDNNYILLGAVSADVGKVDKYYSVGNLNPFITSFYSTPTCTIHVIARLYKGSSGWCGGINVRVYVWDGSKYCYIGDTTTFLTGKWEDHVISVGGVLDTPAKVNGVRFKVEMSGLGSPSGSGRGGINVDQIYMSFAGWVYLDDDSSINSHYSGLGYSFSSRPTTYYINPSNSKGFDSNALIAQITFAANAWEASTSACVFSYVDKTTTAPGSRDGKNIIGFGTVSGSAAAATYIWHFWYHTWEADTILNKDLDWSLTGESGKFDVRNVMTHEFGHWCGLADLYTDVDYWLTMYGIGSAGETFRRTLGLGDKLGLQAVYGK